MDWTLIIAEVSAFGLTQAQIAERCGGCGQSTISEIGIGKTKNPGSSIAFKLIALRDELRSTHKKAA